MEITKDGWRESQNLDEHAQESHLHWRSALYGFLFRSFTRCNDAIRFLFVPAIS